MNYVDIACRVMLAVVFIWSAGSKLRARDFVSFVHSLRPLTDRARPAAVVLIVAEIAVVPLLALTPVWGLVGAAALLTTLSAGVFVVTRRRLVVRCRCFGAGEQIGVPHLVRNLILLAVAVAGLMSTTASTRTDVSAPGVLLAAAAAAIAGVLVIRLHDLVDLFR